MGIRRQAREAALQALFMCDAQNSWDAATLNFCLDHFEVASPIREYAQTLGQGVIANQAEIESKISCASDHWSMSRMAKVDRCLLRLAAFEILYAEDIPVGVAIDEAIEIAKRYGAENSPTFVNGVLDRVAHSLRKQIEVIRETPATDEEAPAVVASDDEDSEESMSFGAKKSDDWRLL